MLQKRTTLMFLLALLSLIGCGRSRITYDIRYAEVNANAWYGRDVPTPFGQFGSSSSDMPYCAQGDGESAQLINLLKSRKHTAADKKGGDVVITLEQPLKVSFKVGEPFSPDCRTVSEFKLE